MSKADVAQLLITALSSRQGSGMRLQALGQLADAVGLEPNERTKLGIGAAGHGSGAAGEAAGAAGLGVLGDGAPGAAGAADTDGYGGGAGGGGASSGRGGNGAVGRGGGRRSVLGRVVGALFGRGGGGSTGEVQLRLDVAHTAVCILYCRTIGTRQCTSNYCCVVMSRCHALPSKLEPESCSLKALSLPLAAALKLQLRYQPGSKGCSKICSNV